MKVKIGGDEIEIDVLEKRGFGVFRGLMFRSLAKAPALRFNIQGSLHSFFVFFNFVVLWLDDENNVVDSRVVRPFTFYINSKKKFSRIVEVPVSRRYEGVVEKIVALRADDSFASRPPSVTLGKIF